MKKIIFLFVVLAALGFGAKSVFAQTAGVVPGLPNNGTNPATLNITLVIWIILGAILAALIIFFAVTRKKK